MILKVYCYKNDKVGTYSAPFVSIFDREQIPEMVRRNLIENQDNLKLDLIKESSLYFLGLFDDKNGNLDSGSPEFIISLSEFFDYSSKKEKEEVKENE